MIILAYFCRCLKIPPCAALPLVCMAQLQVVQTRGAPTLVLLQATAVCTGTLVKLGPCLYKVNATTALHEWLCIFLDIKYEATKSLCLDMQHCIVNTGKNWFFFHWLDLWTSLLDHNVCVHRERKKMIWGVSEQLESSEKHSYLTVDFYLSAHMLSQASVDFCHDRP